MCNSALTAENSDGKGFKSEKKICFLNVSVPGEIVILPYILQFPEILKLGEIKLHFVKNLIPYVGEKYLPQRLETLFLFHGLAVYRHTRRYNHYTHAIA